MSENLLGKNIQYLRKSRGETLEILGNALGYEKNTIKGYESGARMPNLETVKKIAGYFGITIEEILNVKLFESEIFDSTRLVDYNDLFNRIFRILPLVETEGANENDAFAKGMKILREVISTLEKGEFVKGATINEVIDSFCEAAEANITEGYANLLWCTFFLWFEQYEDIEDVKRLQSRLLSKQVDWYELICENQKNVKKLEGKKKEFIEEVDETINEVIGILKGMEQWSQLGDYYLALRYILGIVPNNEYTIEMYCKIGEQMMLSFARLGNKYALDYFKTISDI